MKCYIGYIFDNKKQQVVDILKAVGRYPCDIRGKLHEMCCQNRKMFGLDDNDLRFQYQIIECDYLDCEVK